MSGRFSFSYFSSAYFYLLVTLSLFHLCLSNKNFDDNNVVLCLDNERQALVEFKHGLVDETNRLSSWDVGEERDCCKWVGITCDNSTGHIRHIHLRALDGHCDDSDYATDEEYEEASKQMLRGTVSPFLLHLKQLRHLDLSCNDFGRIQVPKFIGSLRDLTYLNLSRSNFSGMIPPHLGNLSQLQVLCLGSFHNANYKTQLTSMSNMHWLSSLRLLKHLDLSVVDLSKSIDWLQVINSIPSLIQLHLSNCELSDIHPYVTNVNLTSLSLLDLSHNNFNSSFPRWIFSITSLVSLDLSSCSFHRLIPSSIYTLRNLTSLKFLHVSGNDFMSSSSVLRDLSSVGSNLLSLDISGCGISSLILDSLHNLTSLITLDLSLNQLTDALPKSIGNLCNLREIYLEANLSNNTLTHLLESVFKCKSPHLESLILTSSQLSGTIPDSIGRLSFLRSLDLTRNLISGSIPSSIGKLSSLEELYASGNKLNGSLPDSIGQLIHLRYMRLDLNHISGTIPYSIGQLSFLRSLVLGDNLISGPIPSSIGQLSSLEVLDLSNNQLNGFLPHSIGQLSSLRELGFYNNQLEGNIPYSIGRLSSLEILDLSSNHLDGNIPFVIGRLSLLKGLYLSNNQLNGSLPTSIGQLSKLNYLHISSNFLGGVVTETHFSKLTSLKNLDGGGNKLTLRPRKNWIPPFQADTLYLNSWRLGPQFPFWVQWQRDLVFLDISNTGITSLMPPRSFWRSLPNLGHLDMSQNHIQGTLLDIPTTLTLLDLSYNKLTGDLTPISNFSLLIILDLSNNLFVGSLHDLVCSNGMKQTSDLYLGSNHLSGVIPECWDKWPRLEFLELNNNNFTGGIPSTLGSLVYLGSLNMRGNKLSGRLPPSLMSLTNLMILELGVNELVGSIPSWFGTKLPSLEILNLISNNFDGIIPHELCYLQYIHILNLAHNNLSGKIPSCFNNFSVLTGKETILDNFYFTRMGSKDVVASDSLVMKGREDTYSSFLRLVTLLDLSSNNLIGNIPSEITSLRKLTTLNFSRNRLTGMIPEKIGDMKSLETFDLSLNKLYGELPVSLSQLNFLSSFNVSYNNLTGRVPSSTQLQSFNEYNFLGNKICGPPLTKPCVSIEVPKKSDSVQQEDDGADWELLISIVLGFVSGFWIIVAPLMLNRAWRIAYFHITSKFRYMVYDGMSKYCFNMYSK